MFSPDDHDQRDVQHLFWEQIMAPNDLVHKVDIAMDPDDVVQKEPALVREATAQHRFWMADAATLKNSHSGAATAAQAEATKNMTVPKLRDMKRANSCMASLAYLSISRRTSRRFSTDAQGQCKANVQAQYRGGRVSAGSLEQGAEDGSLTSRRRSVIDNVQSSLTSASGHLRAADIVHVNTGTPTLDAAHNLFNGPPLLVILVAATIYVASACLFGGLYYAMGADCYKLEGDFSFSVCLVRAATGRRPAPCSQPAALRPRLQGRALAL